MQRVAPLAGAFRLWNKLGGELVFIHTKRDYKWPWKFPHAFVRTRTGLEIEYVPNAKTLGDYPQPFFIGRLKVRHTQTCPCAECKEHKKWQTQSKESSGAGT